MTEFSFVCSYPGTMISSKGTRIYCLFHASLSSDCCSPLDHCTCSDERFHNSAETLITQMSYYILYDDA